MLCLMVIVRRQWVERERLAYPMVQLPLAMIADDERGRTIKPLFRSGFMWLGFALPFVLASINALHNYFVVVPSVSLSLDSIPVFRGMASLRMYLSLSMVGFSYFVPQNIALGLSFFHLVNVVQRGLLGVLAWGGKDETMGAYSQYTDPIIIHQAMGGMIVLVLGSLWVGRAHIKDVLRKAFLGAPDVTDADEIMSYRVAVWGAIISFLTMGVWLWQSGIPLLFVPLLLFGAFVGFMTIARVVAQGGVAAMFPPTNGPDFVVANVGGTVLGTKGMAGMALSYAWSVDTLILMMSACANGLKLVTEITLPHRRRLFGATVAVIVLTLGCVVVLTLYLGYEYGAINLSRFYFNNVAQYPYRFMEKSILNPFDPRAEYVATHRHWRGYHGWANGRPIPVSVVAFPLAGVSGQLRIRQDVVQRLYRLAHQEHSAQIRRPDALQSPQALLLGASSRRGRRSRDVGAHRLYNRHAKQLSRRNRVPVTSVVSSQPYKIVLKTRPLLNGPRDSTRRLQAQNYRLSINGFQLLAQL